jgi:hypothetical protein
MPSRAVGPALLLGLLGAMMAQGAELRAFISKQCLECHDQATRKSGLSLEGLDEGVTSANAKDWLRALEQLERRTMPPSDAQAPPPTAEALRSAALAIEGNLVSYARTMPGRNAAVLRRLNRSEYRNTVRDLLQLNVESFDPTREFPDDNRVHGFPSNGEQLVTSSFLLRQYLEAAEQIIERAIHFEAKPEVRHWSLLPPFDRTTAGPTRSEMVYFRDVLKHPQPYQSLHTRMGDMPKGGYHPLDDLRSGVPVGGWYAVRIQAEAKYRHADLDPAKFRFSCMWDPAQPLRLSLSSFTLAGIDPDNREGLDYAAQYFQSGQRDLAIWDLPDDRQAWLECRVWLDRGETPRLGFPNGPTDSNQALYTYFTSQKEHLLGKDQLAAYEKDHARGDNMNIFMWFESPRILISRIDIEGPLNDAWPPESHRLVFGGTAYRSDAAGDVLQRFAARAWRRPVASAEVAPLVRLVRAAEGQGQPPEAAVCAGLKAVLCSPQFLYREEKAPALSGHEIATRLSYFLWSSMPDDRLLGLAAGGELERPDVLRAEASRMLADPRAQAFVEDFTNGWLSLNKLGAMAPDLRKFPGYYDNDLEPAMRMETRLFFRQLLRANGPIDRFLDADYTFLNRELAQLYGIDPRLVEAAQGAAVEGLSAADLLPEGGRNAPSLGFARVALADRHRGGLLGQASILTLTANGIDTSPVIRGKWILENILGAPPSPPPPNVPVIEPDIRGATTVRDQLQKHRDAASCRSCHRHIDPPGFALENFDAIGRWRTGYPKEGRPSAPIDASGRFGAGEFSDISGFKAILLGHRDQFARCLVEKLLVDALGRELDLADRPQVREIVEAAAKDGYRLRDLVLLCIASEAFRAK